MKNLKPHERKHLSFNEYLKEQLKDPKFFKEYHKLDAEFAPIEAILKARVEKGLTQKSLAAKMKTKQSAISRIESGRSSPTISFLQKLAAALNMSLQLKFTPN
jgi:ribosome-binding protein aMBF1 (putative translation factor)